MGTGGAESNSTAARTAGAWVISAARSTDSAPDGPRKRPLDMLPAPRLEEAAAPSGADLASGITACLGPVQPARIITWQPKSHYWPTPGTRPESSPCSPPRIGYAAGRSAQTELTSPVDGAVRRLHRMAPTGQHRCRRRAG